MNNSPIGFFDSGLGGTSVLKIAKDVLDKESFIYFGDDKNAPYGEKSREEVFALAKNCVDFLISKGVKAIVIACNTATGVAVKRLRTMYDLPIISMEPAVKVGMKNVHGGKVLVMATPTTLKQEKYKNLVSNLHANDEVVELPCDGLALLVEEGEWEGEKVENYLREKLDFIKDMQIDSCVLGCTHYPFVKNSIDKVFKEMGKDIVIVDGGPGTVNQLKHVLTEKDLLCDESKEQSIEFYTSSDDENIITMMKKAVYGK